MSILNKLLDKARKEIYWIFDFIRHLLELFGMKNWEISLEEKI